jgi:hypothetical protein
MNLTRKVLGLSLAAFVGFSVAASADDSGVGKTKKSLENRIAELEAKLKDAGGLGVKGSGIKISGYVDTSYVVNLADNDAGAANGTTLAGGANNNVGRVFDNQKNSVNLNAFKLTIEKGKDSSKFPAGFRVDTIIGEDAGILNGNDGGLASFGAQGDSDLFLEQAYINLGAPVGNGIDIKVGKMVTLIGYEVIESPANWQFSRSDAFRLAPFTQTGITLGYQWTDWLTSTVGIVNGFDAAGLASGTTGGANLNTDYSFVGRLDITGPKTSYGDFSGFIAGLYGNDNFITTADNSAAISIWNVSASWGRPFNVKPLALGVEFLQRVDSGVSTGAALATSNSAKADALGVYGAWTWNKWLTTSARYSNTWYTQGNGGQGAFQAVTLSPFAGQFTSNFTAPRDITVSSFTLTQAFNVWKDTLLRLEWRHDWTDLDSSRAGVTTPGVGFGAATGAADARSTADTIAVNLVYSF